MKNRESDDTREISMPELQISERLKKFLQWTANIKCVYCLIAIVVLLAAALIMMPKYLWGVFWLRIKGQKYLVLIVLIFCVVTVSLVWKAGQRLDVWVFKAFNMKGRRPVWADWTMLGLTQIGSGVFALAVGGIYLLIDHILAYEIILGTLTLWLVVELMKILIKRTRPYIKLKDVRIVGSRAGGHSFPSGHTSQSFFMAALLLHYFNIGPVTGLLFYAAALLVGITRIYVGMHYPRDVFGGAMLGTAWGLLSVVVNTYIR